MFAIAAVIDHFSDAVVKNPIVDPESKNPQLQEWHTKNLGRLPGLKFMRTLWVCNGPGGPYQFAATKPGTNATRSGGGSPEPPHFARRVRRGRCRTRTNARLRQSPEAREGRSPGSLRRS